MEEDVEDSEAVAGNLSLFCRDKGCRNFRQPFLLFRRVPEVSQVLIECPFIGPKRDCGAAL